MELVGTGSGVFSTVADCYGVSTWCLHGMASPRGVSLDPAAAICRPHSYASNPNLEISGDAPEWRTLSCAVALSLESAIWKRSMK